MNDDKKNIKWENYPGAWEWNLAQLETFARANEDIASLSSLLNRSAGARLIDFTDHIMVPESAETIEQLQSYGYRLKGRELTHPDAILPRVALSAGNGQPIGAAVKVDSIAQYLMVRGLDLPILGSPFSAFRQCTVSTRDKVSLQVIERRASYAVEPVTEKKDYLDLYFHILEQWQTRSRDVDHPVDAMEKTIQLAQQLVKKAGTDLAAYLFFEAERRYWQSRNRAAAVLKKNLDRIGVGWANHDHHTFRSSRELFSQLVRFFTVLGFHLREKFYAGEEAGWGAQVVENPVIDIALFLDVDLESHELDIDFLNRDLPHDRKLGTVGLWCALHGDSILKAGLHHLAVRSDFDKLTRILAGENAGMMNPFSTLPYLKQAFTHGELWPVNPERVNALREQNHISAGSAEKFLKQGAVGSHVENIQRADGFKGFSQKEVSKIIKETDPQTYTAK